MNSKKPIPFSYVLKNGRVYNLEGCTCVVVSYQHHAGWSTPPCNQTTCMFEPEVVEWVLRGSPEEETPNFELMFGSDFWDKAKNNLVVKLIPEGTCFTVRYDLETECEYIEHHTSMEWQIA
jgi:hypothetical protein